MLWSLFLWKWILVVRKHTKYRALALSSFACFVHMGNGRNRKACKHCSKHNQLIEERALWSWLDDKCMKGVLVWSALQDINRSQQMEQYPVCRSTSCPSSTTTLLDVQDHKSPYLTVPGTTVNTGTRSSCSLYCGRMLVESYHAVFVVLVWDLVMALKQ